MTILEILNDVLSQSGFLERGAFANSTNVDDKQMFAIANRVSYEIVNFYTWTELRQEHDIDLVDGTLRYDLPSDFRDFIPDSCWEEDGSRQAEFPVPDARWFMYKFSSFSDGGTLRMRKYGNELEVHDPSTGDSFSFEYISKNAIEDAASTAKERFTVDTDTWLLDDQLLTLGVQAHWQQTKLMPSYREHMQNYFNKMNEAIGRSTGGRTIGGADSGKLGRRSPYTPLFLPSV